MLLRTYTIIYSTEKSRGWGNGAGHGKPGIHLHKYHYTLHYVESCPVNNFGGGVSTKRNQSPIGSCFCAPEDGWFYDEYEGDGYAITALDCEPRQRVIDVG